MCGGIAFNFDLISEEEIRLFLSAQELRAFKKTGEVETFFWSERPILPAEFEGAVHLFDWGNREKTIDLPRTGWARIESLSAGKWNWLNPKEIIIPAARGYEKKVWFNIAKGIHGVLVERDGVERVYMITEPANAKYQNLTKHDRMPKFL
jgi:hypothetical protein